MYAIFKTWAEYISTCNIYAHLVYMVLSLSFQELASQSRRIDSPVRVMEVVCKYWNLTHNFFCAHFALFMSHSLSNSLSHCLTVSLSQFSKSIDRFSSVKEVVFGEFKLTPNIYTHFAFVMSDSKSNDRFSSVMEVVCEEGRITTGGVKCRTNTLPLIGISCQFRAG